MRPTVSKPDLRQDRSNEKEKTDLANGLRAAANMTSRSRVTLTTTHTGVYTTIWASDDMPEGSAWAIDYHIVGRATAGGAARARYDDTALFYRDPAGAATQLPASAAAVADDLKRSLTSVDQSRLPLTYGFLYPFGTSLFFNQVNSGFGLAPENVLWAYPGMFPRRVKVKEIIVSNTIANGQPPSKYKLGLYANVSGDAVFPGAKLSEWTEQTPLVGGNSVWPVNLTVEAGTLLWMVETSDYRNAASFNMPTINVGVALTDQTRVLGMTDVEYFPAGQTRFTYSLAYGWECPRTYDGTLPATFPTSGTVAIDDTNNLGRPLKLWMMRLGAAPGAAALGGSPVTESVEAFGARFALVGNSIVVQVTDDGVRTVDWDAYVEVREVT